MPAGNAPELVNKTFLREKLMRPLIIAAALLGLLLTVAGAMGAHVLTTPAGANGVKTTWDSAMLYGFAHVAATLGILALPLGRWRLVAGWLFIVGVVLFSALLLVKTMVMLEASKATPGADPLAFLGMLAPVGGFAFMGGWLVLALGALAHKPSVVVGD
jgi:uncharacterized membrane protein YgdD (TMEM256/DUF423 family)